MSRKGYQLVFELWLTNRESGLIYLNVKLHSHLKHVNISIYDIKENFLYNPTTHTLKMYFTL